MCTQVMWKEVDLETLNTKETVNEWQKNPKLPFICYCMEIAIDLMTGKYPWYSFKWKTSYKAEMQCDPTLEEED